MKSQTYINILIVVVSLVVGADPDNDLDLTDCVGLFGLGGGVCTPLSTILVSEADITVFYLMTLPERHN